MTNLIVISGETNIKNEAGIINDLFHSGMLLFHLRKPHFTLEEQRTLLSEIEEQFHDKISVHQHYETVIEFGLKYYHVREKDREIISRRDSRRNPQNDAQLTSSQRTLQNLGERTEPVEVQRDTKKSTSFHNYNDLQFESHLWDYCFLSPIFNSLSKPEYKSSFKADFHIEADLYQRVFALGGITKENIAEVFEKEFYGAAVLGSIWQNPANAVNNFKTLEQECRQNVHTR